MNARLIRGTLLEIAKKHMENLKSYKRFEDLVLGGDLRVRGLPVTIKTVRRSG